MEELIASEIEQSYAFFVDWFAGSCPRSEAALARQFVGRLDPGFVLIDPTGNVINVDRLGREIWGGYGTADDFEITADEIRCRHSDGSIAVATYREWQRNAVRSTPANNGRQVTALFRFDDTATNNLRWVMIQETWLPAAVVAQKFAASAARPI